jgi:hypothetical protein
MRWAVRSSGSRRGRPFEYAKSLDHSLADYLEWERQVYNETVDGVLGGI